MKNKSIIFSSILLIPSIALMPVIFTSCGNEQKKPVAKTYDVEILNMTGFSVSPSFVEENTDYNGTISSPLNVKSWKIESITVENTALIEGEDWTLEGNNLKIKKEKINNHISIHVIPIEFDENDYSYKLNDDGTYTLAGFVKKHQISNVVVPEEIKGRKITNIAENAFAGCTQIEYIVISNNLVSIQKNAFANCTSLRTFMPPESTKNVEPSLDFIGEKAFYGCKSLTHFTMPNKVKTIEKNTFEGCEALYSFTFPNSLETICENAFFNCKSLKYISLPIYLKTIKERAFARCDSLVSIKFLGDMDIETIGDQAFAECISLEQFNYPKRLKSISNGLFLNCKSLKSFDFSGNIETIGEQAFSGCESLSTVIFPLNIKTIKSHAFFHCKNLSWIDISVFKADVPDDWSSESVFEGISPSGKIVHNGGIVMDKWKIYFQDKCQLPVDTSWFFEYVDESKIKFELSQDGSSYEVQGFIDGYFQPDILIPRTHHQKNVTVIGKNAFLDYGGLRSVWIPETITKIDDSAFENCHNLKYITLPSVDTSLTTIGNNAFKECWKLERVDNLKENPITHIGDYAFAMCGLFGELVLPPTLTSLGKYAFYKCNGIWKIILPDSLTDVGESAWEGCSSLGDQEKRGGIDLKGWKNVPKWSFKSNTFKDIYSNGYVWIYATGPSIVDALKEWIKPSGLIIDDTNWRVVSNY